MQADEEKAGQASPREKKAPNHEVTLIGLLKHSLERPVPQDALVYKHENLNNMRRCMLTVPMLGNMEFEGVSFIDKQAQWNASKQAKTNAIQCAIFHVRKKFDRKLTHSSKNELNELVLRAMGEIRKGDIIYTTVSSGEQYECTLTLPVLSEMEVGEFRATADSEKDAEQAAAVAAIQELSSDLKTKAATRIAEKAAAKKARDDLRIQAKIAQGNEHHEVAGDPLTANSKVAEEAGDSAQDAGLNDLMKR